MQLFQAIIAGHATGTFDGKSRQDRHVAREVATESVSRSGERRDNGPVPEAPVTSAEDPDALAEQSVAASPTADRQGTSDHEDSSATQLIRRCRCKGHGRELKSTTAAAEALHGVTQAVPGAEPQSPSSSRSDKHSDPERSASVRVTWLGALSRRPALSRVQPDGCQQGHIFKQRRASVIPNTLRKSLTPGSVRPSSAGPGSWVVLSKQFICANVWRSRPPAQGEQNAVLSTVHENK